jgi:Cu/Ag efflux protein CusF
MRRLILAVVLTSCAGWAYAQDPQSQPPTQPQSPTQSQQQQPGTMAKDKEMTATVVATDPTVKTITVKKEGAAATGQMETTIAVDDKALTNLKSVKSGDKVKLTLKTDPMTGKDSVTSIEKSMSTTPER